MTAARGFLVTGPLFLLFGLGIGMHMGASNDHTLMPVHAHLNLLGFVLMMVFGLAYDRFQTAGSGRLALVHFWLHLIASLVLLVMLWMLFTGKLAETAMFPLAPLCELAIFIGVLIFAWNMFRHAR